MDREINNHTTNNGVFVPRGGGGDHSYVNSNSLHASPQPGSAYSSVFSNSDEYAQDLNHAFSRMSLYNGGSSINGNGDLYNRMLLQRNHYREQSVPTTPFYDSVPQQQQRPFLSGFNSVPQNGYGSSASSIMDDFITFRSMNNNPFQQLPSSDRHLQNTLFYPPPKQPSVFDSQFARTNQFNHGRGNVWRSSNSSSIRMQRSEHQFDEYQSNLNFADLRGNLVNYAMEQNGCRILQIMFEKMGREEFDILFEELICYVTQLMMDQYGNFIFQKLVQVCSVDQRTQIVVAITRDPLLLLHICLNSYGTRAVQKLLMYLTTREQKGMIVAAISPGVFDMSKDGNAHHVIVHCIKNFPYELNKAFLDQMAQYCFELSTDQSGCCVVQSCVDHSRGEGRDRLVREILSVAQLLSEDRFGNYVVQCLLRQMDQMINMRVWEKLKGNFTSLSCNKFGSNVVEACLEQSDRRHVDLIILEMLENPHVSTLFSDPFGNYVIQVALSQSKGSVHEALVREIQKHAPSLQSNQYGKMTLSWFDPKKRRRSMKNRSKYGQFHP